MKYNNEDAPDIPGRLHFNIFSQSYAEYQPEVFSEISTTSLIT